jgi:hypothetical protein
MITRTLEIAPAPERPQMDPTILIAGVSALLKAIDVWVKYRDSKRAAEAFQNEQRQGRNDPAIVQEAQVVARIVPQDILDALTGRASACWSKYKNVLDGGDDKYLPDEVDSATKAVKACICREIARIEALGEPLPPGGKLRSWKDLYCKTST